MYESDGLQEYSIFGGLDKDQLAYIATLLKEDHYAPGQVILKEGELNNKVYFINQGTVRVDKFRCGEDGASGCSTAHIANLVVGDTFGEMELIDIQPCIATVTASEEVSVLTLSNVDFYALRKKDMKAFTLVIMNLARDISRRLRVMDSRFSGAAE